MQKEVQVADRDLVQQLSRPNAAFLPQLDLLRSIAVCLVVIDHTALAFGQQTLGSLYMGRLGVTGVWLFFVHTALVLMWSLQRKPYALDFYVRRAFRIYPLAMAATIAVVVLHAPLTSGIIPYFGTRPGSWGNFLGNLFLCYNLSDEPTTHFAILHVVWTLPWEIQMYVVLPALFAFVDRERTLWSILILWALSVAVLRAMNIPVLSFLGSVPNFLAGVIAFVAFSKFRPRLPAWLFPLFLLLLCAIPQINPQAHPLLRSAYLLTILLALGLPFFHQFRQPALRLVVQRVARYSYGIYLIHPFALWLAFHGLHLTQTIPVVAVVIVATGCLSVLGYHALEKPMIDLGSRVAAHLEQRALAAGADHAL